MRKTAFTIVHCAETAEEAQGVIDRLRTTGLHPAELALTAPLPFSSGSKRIFPIEVPPDESTKAKSILAERFRIGCANVRLDT